MPDFLTLQVTEEMEGERLDSFISDIWRICLDHWRRT
jgi:hypothetical protein